MFDLINSRIARLSIHLLDHDETPSQLHLTSTPVPQDTSDKWDILSHFMLSPFNDFQGYKRFSDRKGNMESHIVNGIIKRFFDGTTDFHDTTRRLAQALFRVSDHPGIKSGDLLVALIEDIGFEDELVNGIAIIKSETKSDFLKLTYLPDEAYEIIADTGIQVDKIDKGCLIFNVRPNNGFAVASIDRTARNMDAQYWNDSFLHLKYLDPSFATTQQYMNMAQTYVSHQMTEDFDMQRADQVGVMNDAANYFKSNQTYDESAFQAEVFQDEPQVIESFQKYKQAYANELGVELPDQFNISNLAVKKSAKDFKSVLKLDKNFHVYIHGDRSNIIHGTDPDGRKFYKLFYENEA